jgi:hypothetical protein
MIIIIPPCRRRERVPTFIRGDVSTTDLLRRYPAKRYPGSSASTEMGLMQSDGVRWLVQGTPPIPPGAAELGYTQNLYTVFPAEAEIAYSPDVKARIYSGFGPSSIHPTSAAYTTDENGQLQLIYPEGGEDRGLFCTQNALNSQQLAGNLGTLPYALAGRGLYTECAFTIPTPGDVDHFNAFFVMPQQHNTIQLDSNPAFPNNYEQWHELDVNENGHGTDQGGAYRGAYLQWAGVYRWAWTLAATPTVGATSVKLTQPWTGEPGSFPIKFDSGESRNSVMVPGSVGPYSISALTIACKTPAVEIGYTRFMSPSNIQTTPLDYTTEHTFGGAYDPIGGTWTIWEDGKKQKTVSTRSASDNAFRDTGLMYLLLQTNSHGKKKASRMSVRYFAMWTP